MSTGSYGLGREAEKFARQALGKYSSHSVPGAPLARVDLGRVALRSRQIDQKAVPLGEAILRGDYVGDLRTRRGSFGFQKCDVGPPNVE